MLITKYIDIYGFITKIEIEGLADSWGSSIKGLKLRDDNNNSDILVIENDDNIYKDDIVFIHFSEGENSRDYSKYPDEIFNYYFNTQIKDCELYIEYDEHFYRIDNMEEELELEIKQEIQNAHSSDRFYFYPIKVKNNTDTCINIGTCRILYQRNMNAPYQGYSFNIDDTIYPGEEKHFIINKIQDKVDENLIISNTKFLEELDELYALYEVTLEIDGKKRFFSF